MGVRYFDERVRATGAGAVVAFAVAVAVAFAVAVADGWGGAVAVVVGCAVAVAAGWLVGVASAAVGPAGAVMTTCAPPSSTTACIAWALGLVRMPHVPTVNPIDTATRAVFNAVKRLPGLRPRALGLLWVIYHLSNAKGLVSVLHWSHDTRNIFRLC